MSKATAAYERAAQKCQALKENALGSVDFEKMARICTAAHKVALSPEKIKAAFAGGDPLAESLVMEQLLQPWAFSTRKNGYEQALSAFHYAAFQRVLGELQRIQLGGKNQLA